MKKLITVVVFLIATITFALPPPKHITKPKFGKENNEGVLRWFTNEEGEQCFVGVIDSNDPRSAKEIWEENEAKRKAAKEAKEKAQKEKERLEREKIEKQLTRQKLMKKLPPSKGH